MRKGWLLAVLVVALGAGAAVAGGLTRGPDGKPLRLLSSTTTSTQPAPTTTTTEVTTTTSTTGPATNPGVSTAATNAARPTQSQVKPATPTTARLRITLPSSPPTTQKPATTTTVDDNEDDDNGDGF